MEKKLGLSALTALVLSSMLGAGVFSLPQNMAMVASPAALLIGWLSRPSRKVSDDETERDKSSVAGASAWPADQGLDRRGAAGRRAVRLAFRHAPLAPGAQSALGVGPGAVDRHRRALGPAGGP